MATNDPTGSGPTGSDPGAGGTADQPESVGTPDPAGGGCMKLGWGCLPVVAAMLALPGYLFF